MKDYLRIVEVNTTAAREHVADIERDIRFLKERTRCVVCAGRRAGIEYLHKLIVIWLVYFIVKTVNAVPAKLGIFDVYSPSEIVTQRKFDYALDGKVQFLTW